MWDKIHNMDIVPLMIIGTIILTVSILFRKWIGTHKRTPENTTADDLLHDILFKAEYCIVCDKNELYIIDSIKVLRQNISVDQKKLDMVEDKFRRRFAELHLIDEISAEHLNHAYNEAKVKYNQTLKQLSGN